MIQPIQNAMHLYKTDSIFTDLGKKLVELRSIVHAFRNDVKSILGERVYMFSDTLDVIDEKDVRRGFFTVVDEPSRVHLVLKDLANLEIMWRIAEKEDLNPVRFQIDRLSFNDAVDISLKKSEAVPGSLELGQSDTAHAVITGPNGGGKSSFLRSVLQSVLLGHAYGYAPAKDCTMPRFLWIASGLQLRDTPGVYSMFETEVKFAADALKHSYFPVSNGPGLVLFDELFHSTNPPDSERTARLFLKHLWASPPNSVFSVVSTHIFPLIEKAPKNVKAICCPAKELDTGDIEYTYSVQPGVCKVSSVKKVWERFGLRPRPCRQNLSVKENTSGK
jgi:DNA mismatch repair ATPase MutS